MTELIKLHTEYPDFPIHINDLAMFLELNPKSITQYITGERGNFGFSNTTDFYAQSVVNPYGGRPEKIHWLSIKASKEICMLADGPKGKIAREYFIECEERTRQTVPPMTFLDTAKALVTALENNQALASQLAIAAPKAQAFEILMETGDNIDFAIFADIVQNKGFKGYGRNTLMGMCREKSILKTDGPSHNLPYQQYLSAGYFVVVEVVINEKIRKKTLITPKGQPWLLKELGFVNG